MIALSSGEAEYYGLVRLVSGTCNVLGEQSRLKDWDILLPIQAYMDASTGLSKIHGTRQIHRYVVGARHRRKMKGRARQERNRREASRLAYQAVGPCADSDAAAWPLLPLCRR